MNSTFESPTGGFILKGDILFDFESPVEKTISAKLEQPNNNKTDIIFNFSIDDQGVSFQFQSPINGFEDISGKTVWELNLVEPRIELNVAMSDFSGKIVFNSTLGRYRSLLALSAMAKGSESEQSASLTAEFDLRDSFHAGTRFTLINEEGNIMIIIR